MKKFMVKTLALTLAATACIGLSGCNQETLVVYTESGFAPFEYVKDGKIVGVDVDIMNMVGKKLNKKVVFEDVDFDTIIDAVAQGSATNVGAAGISVTPERQEKVNFSTEYYTAALYVIYQKSDANVLLSTTTDDVQGIYWQSIANLDKKVIAVQNGTTADLFLADEIAEGGAFWNADTETSMVQKSGFSDLSTAVADVGLNAGVLIIDELPAKQLIAGNDDLACAPLYYQGGANETDEAAIDTYAICVTKGQDELLAAINEVLAELGDSGVQALVNKHLGLN
jgi:polar amino acid transport system substrate-binding protein